MRRHLVRLFRRRSRLSRLARRLVADRQGVEVGGPSRLFSRKGRLPLYASVADLDGCDALAATTRRPGREATEGFVYDPRRPPGRLLLTEASDLEGIDDASYDFVLASHVLEHIANPLAALAAWRRVVREDGVLVLIVPHRERTFDHRRPVTPFEHLLEDETQGMTEDDLTHAEEMLAHHDIAMDPGVDTRAELEERTRANAANRCMHHHVFDTELVLRAVDQAGWQILDVDTMRPFHIAVLARRPTDGAPPCNRSFFEPGAAWRMHSPFDGDRSR